MIYVNDLIKWDMGQEEPLVERVLWIDRDSSYAYVVEVGIGSRVPHEMSVAQIEEAIDIGKASKLDTDPWFGMVLEEYIQESHRQMRDAAWEKISFIVSEENEPDIYDRKKRGVLIQEASEKFGVSERVIYKYLYRYWQRGKTRNALLPDFDKCGGKGKDKTLREKKIGRPRKNIDVSGVGINVDEETKKIFRIAISRYYETQKENTFTDAYNLMIKEFYTEDYIIEDGIRKPILIPMSQIPRLNQFQYWYNKEQDIVKALKARKGDKKYQLKHRAILGTTDANIIGPGSKYQIDATVGDIYLVSSYNRNWIIGRPVIYIVIDVFSRMVTGVYVGLEGPSWIGAMMALSNAMTDKVAFCSEYGIAISPEDWPCYHAPQAILADRGEMEGKHAETFIKTLNIRVENTPPFRADWKPIVEQYFKTLNTKVKPFVPGAIDVDFRQRGGKDYRLDAKLTIREFTELIIRCILTHNQKNWMKNYQTDEIMISDEVNPIPIELWNWGIANRSGRLRSFPEDIVKLNLMPSDTALITQHGVKYKKMYYSCEKAISEMWFERARNKGNWKESISYDPRNMEIIYIRSEDGRSYEKCTLLDQRRYSGKSIDEIEYLWEYEQRQKEKRQEEMLQSKVDQLSEIENIVAGATKRAEEQKDETLSRTSRVKGIRQNRSNEKTLRRKTEAFELEKDMVSGEKVLAEVIPISEDADEDLEYPDNIEFLRKKQRERLKGKNE